MEEIGDIARRYRGRTVAVQAPEGLKSRALELAKQLEGRGVKVVLFGDPTYGACMVADSRAKAIGAAALVHLGHAPIPGTDTALKVHYIEMRDDLDPGAGIEEACEILISPVGLVTTVQHVGMLPRVKTLLEERGYKIHVGEAAGRAAYDGQILGCDLSTAHSVEDEVANFLYIGTGRFHPLGVALATGKPVVAMNPYTGTAALVDAEELLRKRFATIARAMDARRIAIVVTPEGGQSRLALARDLAREFAEAGREAHIIAMDHVLPEAVENFRLDAVVVAACPRIPLDDQERYQVPVLTVGEARMLLKGVDGVLDGEYTMDEFSV
ncbi:MAG: diphthamide biosynthesis enzyme Dph2 [Thermoplasmata archaeon]|nr:diphthamide biosynthesis enzyme Dph2 [Thermoplasmata archaeon]